MLGRQCYGKTHMLPLAVFVRELELIQTTVHALWQALQRNAVWMQPDIPLEDRQTETDEMSQNAGEKHIDRAGPSCRRTN